MCGAFAHGAIFLVRDSGVGGSAIGFLVANRSAVVSLLSFVCLFLGFHTLGLYVHNDVMQALGSPEKQLALLPVFAEWLQLAHGSHLGTTLTAGDFLVHHAIALGLHTTTLVLVKAAVNSRSSKLMPDKVSFGYGFPCDGPGRGGTCDISAFDGLYLAIFWMLNTVGWITFYWHWKHLALASNSVGMWRDVPLRASGVGNRFHVPHLMARLLARANRVHRMGPRAYPYRQSRVLEGQARCIIYRPGTVGGSCALQHRICSNVRAIRYRS